MFSCYGQKKRRDFDNLHLSDITDDKLFWKTISPLFIAKNVSEISNMTLAERNETLTDDDGTKNAAILPH